MASSSMRKMTQAIAKSLTNAYSSSPKSCHWLRNSFCHFYASKASKLEKVQLPIEIADDVPTSGISRPLSEILKELNKKVPETLLKVRVEPDGFSVKYLPWHIANRILNLHAPEWSGEVRSITYSVDGKSVSVVYRVTLYGTDAEMHRESTGTALVNVNGYGNAVQMAESMAFRRACARFGLGLHLYHEDMS